MGDAEDTTLPADIVKEVVRKPSSYTAKAPKKGDEVRIHYTGSRASNGFKFDSSYNTPEGRPYSFTLGVGMVMEAWDRVVANMKKGELSRFTIPEMYLSGGSPDLLAKLPDDGADVVYEIELLGFTSITDLFKDGGVIQTVLEDGEEYGQGPKMGDEVQISYELSCNGKVLDSRPECDFRLGFGGPFATTKAIDKALLGMRKDMAVSLRCRPDYAFGEAGDSTLGVPSKSDVVVKVQLLQIYEFEDAGKKAFWGEGLVMKKAIKPIRSRLCPGMDGTKCTVKLHSVKQGDEQLAGEKTFEVTVGSGELCDAMEAACARMRKGEVALVTVQGPASLHAPGEPGVVTAQAGAVIYHMEMLDFGNPPPDDGPSDSAELLRFATEQKERGSAHFKAGRVRLAQERYSRVVELLPRYKRPLGSHTSVEVFEDEGEREAARNLKNTSRLNLAACALKLESYYAASRVCNEVLEEDPNNIKALYRRAQGFLGTKDHDDAVKDCRRILEIEPGNKEAQLLLHKIKQSEKDQAKLQRAQFGGSLLKK
eukprot:TRINITY_DN26905_c0_g1_i1.p1 TRINITY_DN26905_c0_g1~~TRINITY_DN26905_c0_g1_i1.p1  ORF type:complete len:560 (+),score=108.95 TRINITY_DN26905_c0_g1_i1:68-1681(+)